MVKHGIWFLVIHGHPTINTTHYNWMHKSWNKSPAMDWWPSANLAINSWPFLCRKKWYLVGGWAQPLWKIWKSDWIIIPTMGENKKCSKPPMRYWTTEPSNFRGNSTCPKRCQTLKTSAPKRMVTATAQLVSLFHPINCLVKWQDFPYEKLPQDIKAWKT